MRNPCKISLGLRVVLKTPQSDYLCSTESAGFIIVLKDNNQTAFPDIEGYKVAPGTDSYIAVTKVEENGIL